MRFRRLDLNLLVAQEALQAWIAAYGGPEGRMLQERLAAVGRRQCGVFG